MSKKYNNLDANVLKKKKSTPCTQLNCQPLQGEKKKQKNIVRESVLCVWGGGRPSKIENQILKNIPAGCENVYEGVCVCGHTEKQTKKKQKAIANVL